MVLSAQESREQADQCIDRARTAASASERKLYLRLARSGGWKSQSHWSPTQSGCARRRRSSSHVSTERARDQSRKNPLGAVFPPLVGRRRVSKHLTVGVACPACAGLIIFCRSETPHIDACGFESYELECRTCRVSLACIIDPFDETLLPGDRRSR